MPDRAEEEGIIVRVVERCVLIVRCVYHIAEVLGLFP